MEQKFKKCIKCGEEKLLSHFRKAYKRFGQDILPKQYYKSKCKKCEFKERQGKKFESKAADAIGSHAKRLGVSVEKMHDWGITNEWVAFMFLREWTLYIQGFHSCINCFGYGEKEEDGCFDEITVDATGKKTGALTRGDFHLDIIDKERVKRMGILTRSNCRIICKTANNKKGSKDPTEYDLEVKRDFDDRESLKKGIQIGLSKVSVTEKSAKEKPVIHKAGEQLKLFVS